MMQVLCFILLSISQPVCVQEDVCYPAPMLERSWGSNGTETIYGYINRQGETVIQPQWDYASYFQEGYAVVYNQPWFIGDLPRDFPIDDLREPHSLINKKGEVVASYDFIAPFSNGYAVVSVIKDSVWYFGYINASLELVAPPRYKQLGDYNEGMFPALLPTYDTSTPTNDTPTNKTTNKWGYIASDGTVRIQPQYDSARSFHEGRACVAYKDESGNFIYGFIDREGNRVIEPKYRTAEDFHEGIAVVSDGTRSYFGIDLLGKRWDLPSYDYLSSFSEGKAVAACRNPQSLMDYGFIDETGSWVIQETKNPSSMVPQLHPYIHGIAIMAEYRFGTTESIDSGWFYFYINEKGGRLMQESFIEASPFYFDLALVRFANPKKQFQYAYLNRQGKKIWVSTLP